MTYTKFEYGPLDTYEIIWTSGQVEYIQAHQVLTPQSPITAGLFGEEKQKPAWTIHGEVDGRWRLLLTAPVDDIRTVRNVTHTHDVAESGGGS